MRERICLLSFTCNYVVSALPLGALDGLRYFIVALPEPSIKEGIYNSFCTCYDFSRFVRNPIIIVSFNQMGPKLAHSATGYARYLKVFMQK